MMDTASHGVLLSVRPRFSRALLDGSKGVELRRQALRVEPGTIIALYEASPTKAVSGFLLVRAVYEATPEDIWARVGGRAQLSRGEYDTYYAGCRRAFAIEVSHALRLAEPLSLRSLRRGCPEFMPPQSFRYFAALPSSLVRLVIEALMGALLGRDDAFRGQFWTDWMPGRP